MGASVTSLMSQLMTAEVQEVLQRLGGKSEETRNSTEEDNADMGVQKEADGAAVALNQLRDTNLKLTAENERLRQEIVKLKADLSRTKVPEDAITDAEIKEVKTYKDYQNVAKRIWSEKDYKRAFLAVGKPVKSSRDTDLVVLYDSVPGLANICNSGMVKAFERGFPGLENLTGKSETLVVTTKRFSDTQETGNDRWVNRMEVNEDREDLFNMLSTLRDTRRAKVAVYPTITDPEGDSMRKMLVCIFGGTGVKCLVYTQERTGREKIREMKKVARNTEAILVKETGKTYADLLKIVKESIPTDSVPARAIRTIREERKGQMVIVTKEGEKDSIEKIRNNLKRHAKIEVDMAKKRLEGKNIIIREIDAITTEEEVSLALSKTLDIPPEECKLGRLRPYFGGNQVITAYIEKGKADKLLATGEFRIGINMCSVVERVSVVQCYRCWEYGHTSRNCSGEDRSEICRMCARPGHKEVACNLGIPICLNCKVSGHKAGSGKCPEFRKALSKARRAKERRPW